MSLWKIEVFANKTDSVASREGYVSAKTEADAAAIAAKAMGANSRADLTDVKKVTSLPPGVIWTK